MDGDGSGKAPRGFSLDDLVDQLCELASRTNMATIETVLRTLPRGDEGVQDAALETAVAARRMVRATADFAASLREAQTR